MKKFIIILFFVAFWFKGNTLYYAVNDVYNSSRNYMQFPSKSDIKYIRVEPKLIEIHYDDGIWKMYYSDNPLDWIVFQ